MTNPIPAESRHHHSAVLGKTGSGKTSTAKLIVEAVAAEGARVCILDPIKSDWWGLISSFDGKHPGLPFHILGGPHGHIPLHSGAGKAIGEVVATGTLPLSIIDMADFEPGGQARFFVDFAPTLLRRMRGVVYLVIEEAHLFAPKERSGIGSENMSIHWAKMLATAGRSKGIRLILVTQRTQALHNALLGSCETLIAHRLTAPADQEPVLKWLKANADKSITDAIAASIASLPTGTGWICSGEAKVFERRAFPRIATYDNTATPTDDTERQEVRTAAVDRDKLRALFGEAVKQAGEDDPAALRKRIAELEAQAKQREPAGASQAEIDAAYRRGRFDEWEDIVSKVTSPLAERLRSVRLILDEADRLLKTPLSEDLTPPADAAQSVEQRSPKPQAIGSTPVVRAIPTRRPANGPGEKMPAAARKMLTALAQYPDGLARAKVGILAGYSPSSGHFDNILGWLRSQGYATKGTPIQATAEGLRALGSYEPLPTGRALLEYWLTQLAKGEAAMLASLADVYPRGLTRDQLGERSGYSSSSGHFDNCLGRLRTLELVTGGRSEPLKATADLF